MDSFEMTDSTNVMPGGEDDSHHENDDLRQGDYQTDFLWQSAETLKGIWTGETGRFLSTSSTVESLSHKDLTDVVVQVVGLEADPPTLFIRWNERRRVQGEDDQEDRTNERSQAYNMVSTRRKRSEKTNNNSGNSFFSYFSPAPSCRCFHLAMDVIDVCLDRLYLYHKQQKQHAIAPQRYSARDLLSLGAIWRSQQPPGHRQGHRVQTRNGPKENQRKPKGKSCAATRWKRQFLGSTSNQWICHCQGQHDANINRVTLRVHAQPQRFPIERWRTQQQGVAPHFLSSSIVHHAADLGYMVMNKPGAIPAHATVDNGTENLLHLVQEYFEKRPEWQHSQDGIANIACSSASLSTVPHRLDTDTSGLQLVSNKHFAAYFGKLLERKTVQHTLATPLQPTLLDGTMLTVQKRYRCLVYIPNNDNVYRRLQNHQSTHTVITHYVDKHCQVLPRAFLESIPQSSKNTKTSLNNYNDRVHHINVQTQREPRKEQQDDQQYQLHGISSWQECQMKIQSVGPRVSHYQWKQQQQQQQQFSKGEFNIKGSCARSGSHHTKTDTSDDMHVTELMVDLLTGRTHQIRGQLAFLGCPIVGDLLYGAAPQKEDDAAAPDNFIANAPGSVGAVDASKNADEDTSKRPQLPSPSPPLPLPGLQQESSYRRTLNHMALQCCYLSFEQPTWSRDKNVRADGSSKKSDMNAQRMTAACKRKENGMATPKTTKRKKEQQDQQQTLFPSGKLVEYSLDTAWWSASYHKAASCVQNS